LLLLLFTELEGHLGLSLLRQRQGNLEIWSLTIPTTLVIPHLPLEKILYQTLIYMVKQWMPPFMGIMVQRILAMTRTIGIPSKGLPMEVSPHFMSYNLMERINSSTRQIGMTICLKSGNLQACIVYPFQGGVKNSKRTSPGGFMNEKRSIISKIQKHLVTT